MLPSYTPALFSLSRLPAPQKVGCRGLELDGDLDPLIQAQFLNGTLRHEGRQREAAVNGDAHMEPENVFDGPWVEAAVLTSDGALTLPDQELTFSLDALRELLR